jgi:von Willebrand factor type D domain
VFTIEKTSNAFTFIAFGGGLLGAAILSLLLFILRQRRTKSKSLTRVYPSAFLIGLGTTAAVFVTLIGPPGRASADPLVVRDGLQSDVQGCLQVFQDSGVADIQAIATELQDLAGHKVFVNRAADNRNRMTVPFPSDEQAAQGGGPGAKWVDIYWSPDTITDLNDDQPLTYAGKPVPSIHGAVPCEALLHEMAHALDAIDGDLNESYCDDTGIVVTEVRATILENKLRKYLGFASRDYYGKKHMPVNGIDACTPSDSDGLAPVEVASGDALHLVCPPASCASSNGDPHITTVDGEYYDFQASGEFIALRSDSTSLQVQIRQQPWPGNSNLSINTAVAMNVQGDHFGVYADAAGLSAHLNGEVLTLKEGSFTLPHGGVVVRADFGNGSVYSVTWPDGSRLIISPVGVWGLSVEILPSEGLTGHLHGLLGAAAPGRTHRVMSSSGAAIDPAVFSDLYGVFSRSWRISQKNSLFDYDPGKSTLSYTDLSLPSRPVKLSDVPGRQAAERMCSTTRSTQDDLWRGCVLDVAATGQMGFWDNVRTVQLTSPPRRCAPVSYTSSAGRTMQIGAVDCYQLAVRAGDVVRVRVLSTDAALNANLDFIDPQGKSTGCGTGTGDNTFDCTAATTGTYTVMVSDYYKNKFVGPYRIWASRL